MPDLKFREIREPEYSLTLESVRSALGALVIYIDAEEITVAVGPHHHCHISLYMYGDLGPAIAVVETAKAAVKYVCDILEDRLCSESA
jgi:hypothetical protein